MAENTKPKILLLHRGDDESLARLQKALSAFSELLVPDCSIVTASTHLQNTSDLSAIFCCSKLATAEPAELLGVNIPVFLFSTEDISLEQLRSDTSTPLVQLPCILIKNIPTIEIMRVCYNLVLPRSGGGITHFFEKGATVLVEKIQSLNTIGEILDKASVYIWQERKQLVSRLVEIRQVVTSLVYEAYAQSTKANFPYPTVDIQLVANPEKFAFTLRFPANGATATALKQSILSAKNFTWYMAWQASDLFMINEYSGANEIEVKVLLYAGRTYNEPSYRSIAVRNFSERGVATSLLAPLKNYEFKTIAELGKDTLAVTSEISALSTDELSALPPAARARINQLEANIKQLNTQIERRVKQTQKGSELLSEVRGKIAKQKGEMVIAAREHQKEKTKLERSVSALEEKIEEYKNDTSLQEAAKSIKNMEDISKKLEALESEKNELKSKLEMEKLKLEESEEKIKRHATTIDVKNKEVAEYRTMLAEKKQDILTLKGQISALERAVQKAESDSKAGQKMNSRGAESKDASSKQELKALKFKLEHAEKTHLAKVNDANEKVKMLEKKLDAAKQKELELIRKIQQLTADARKLGKDAA